MCDCTDTFLGRDRPCHVEHESASMAAYGRLYIWWERKDA